MKFVNTKFSNPQIDKFLLSKNLLSAKNELYRLISTDKEFAFSTQSWSDYANKIAAKTRNRVSKLRFWNDLNNVLINAEKAHGDTIYRGVIYWALASIYLYDGDKYTRILNLLKLAYQQDFEYSKSTETLGSQKVWEYKAMNLAAHRLIDILELIIQDVNRHYLNDPDLKRIKLFLSDQNNRRELNKHIATVFNNQFQSTYFNALSWKPFDLLLGRNPYRAHLQSFYEAAKWIVYKRDELKDSNLEKYGATYAIMILSGTLIEGILLKLPRVRKVLRTKKGYPTFGKIVGSYFNAYKLSLSKEISVFLRIILYYRNRIHPSSFGRKIDRRINMDFATFIYRLAERCVIMLAIRHKREP